MVLMGKIQVLDNNNNPYSTPLQAQAPAILPNHANPVIFHEYN